MKAYRDILHKLTQEKDIRETDTKQSDVEAHLLWLSTSKAKVKTPSPLGTPQTDNRRLKESKP